MLFKRASLLWLAGLPWVLPSLVVAAPDAGTVLQQLESLPTAPLPRVPTLKSPQAPTPSASQNVGPVLRVSVFRMEGVTLLDPQRLQNALAGFLGRDLTLTQLQEAAWIVTQTYRQAGWLVNAFVPPQEIAQGEVRIRVVEARLGHIHVDIPPHVRIGTQQIRDLVLAKIEPGQPLNLKAIDHALMLMDELSGVVAMASFAPSAIEGSTDLMVVIGGGKPLNVQITRDNHGARSTGQNRLLINMGFNSLLGIGDLLGLTLVETEGSHFRRAAYSWPLGSRGLRLGVQSSHIDYAFNWNNFPLEGFARTSGLDLSIPWLRSPRSRWGWLLAADHKQLQNRSNDAVTSDYSVDVGRVSLNGVWQDAWLGPAQSSLGVAMTAGHVNHTTDGSGINGKFSKLNLAFTREQGITGGLSWYVQAQTQSANRNLDSSEKLFLGGSSGVRAYPANEVGGVSGHAATLGLRQRLQQGLTLSGFVDWGRVKLCREPLNACLRDKADGSKEPASQALQGHGLSLNWQVDPGLDFSVIWSRRLGHHPNPDANGQDSDQTRILDRLWLSAAVRF